MGLMMLSLVLSLMAGCSIWLVIGDRLPLDSELKWQSWQNIALYALACLVPLYLVIFAIF